jgi:hypothetical protein
MTDRHEQKAREIVEAYFTRNADAYPGLTLRIASALREEAERCARIAEKVGRWDDGKGAWKAQIAADIEAAIREESQR